VPSLGADDQRHLYLHGSPENLRAEPPRPGVLELGCVHPCESPCVERPARQLRGPCAFDLCGDPVGPLAFGPGRLGPAQPIAPNPISLSSRSR
jgi:hypothetical protein